MQMLVFVWHENCIVIMQMELNTHKLFEVSVTDERNEENVLGKGGDDEKGYELCDDFVVYAGCAKHFCRNDNYQ